FSPYMAGHIQGHLDLTFIPLVPVIFILVEDLFWRRPRSQVRTGILLGLAVGAQTLINEELTVMVALAAVVSLLVAAILIRGAFWGALRRCGAGLATSFAVFAIMTGNLFRIQLFGPYRIPGVPLDSWSAVPADWLEPTDRLVNLLRLPEVPAARVYGYNTFELTAFIGVLMAVFVLAAMVLLRRRLVAWVTFVVAIVFVVFTAGAHLQPGGHLPLPYIVVAKIPMLSSLLPLRLSLIVDFALGLIVALALDRLRTVRSGYTRVGIGCLAAVALLSFVPRPPATYRLHEAAFFTSAADMQAIPDGSPVLLLPFPDPTSANGRTADYAQLWQAQSGMRFKMLGGYGIRSDQNSVGGFARKTWDSPLARVARAATKGDTFKPLDLAVAKRQLARDKIRFILVVHNWPHSAAMLGTARALAGRGADKVKDGVSLWILTQTS
ncbi:MAG: hypothetical protein ACRDNS_29840, partial [Trebonia sp.]